MPLINVLAMSQVGGVGGPAAFDPVDLFSSGESGVYFDATDKTSIFSAVLDNSGNFDPAVGGSAGGILDKSQMGAGQTAADYISNQSNLLSDGGFDAPGSWTTTAGVSVTGSAAVFDGTTASATIEQSAVTSANSWYYVKVTVANYVAGELRVDVGLASDLTAFGCDSDGVHEFLTYANVASGDGDCNLESSVTPFEGDVTGFEIKILEGSHAFGEGASNAITVEQDTNGKTYLAFDSNSDFTQRTDGITWADDMVATWAFAPIGSTFTQYSSSLSYTASTNWSFGNPGGSTYTPRMHTSGVTTAWTHTTIQTALSLWEVVFDDVANTFDVHLDGIEVATSQTLGGGSGLDATGELKLGVSQSGGANELPCAWYGAVIYEGTAPDTDLRAWADTAWGTSVSFELGGTTLFPLTETGHVYDIQDLTSLFTGLDQGAGSFSPSTTTDVAKIADKAGITGTYADYLTGLTDALTDGDITSDSWTTSSGIAYNSGAYDFDGTNVSALLSQASVLTDEAYYVVTVTVSAYTSGSARIQLGGDANANSDYDIDSATTFTFFYKAQDGGSNTFAIESNSGDTFIGSIGSVSVKEVSGVYMGSTTVGTSPTLLQHANDGYYLEFDGGDWMRQPDDVPLGDDMIVSCAVNADDDAQWTAIWSLDTTTDILLGNQASGGTSFVPGLRNATDTEYTDAGGDDNGINVWDVYIDETSNEFSIEKNGTEVLAATTPTTTVALHATANRLRIGTDPSETNHLSMDFYGLVMYEGTEINVLARRELADAAKTQMDEYN